MLPRIYVKGCEARLRLRTSTFTAHFSCCTACHTNVHESDCVCVSAYLCLEKCRPGTHFVASVPVTCDGHACKLLASHVGSVDPGSRYWSTS